MNDHVKDAMGRVRSGESPRTVARGLIEKSIAHHYYHLQVYPWTHQVGFGQDMSPGSRPAMNPSLSGRPGLRPDQEERAVGEGGLEVVCAWCKKLIHKGKKGPDGRVSHGICPECDAKVRKEVGLPPRREALVDPIEAEYGEYLCRYREQGPRGPLLRLHEFVSVRNTVRGLRGPSERRARFQQLLLI